MIFIIEILSITHIETPHKIYHNPTLSNLFFKSSKLKLLFVWYLRCNCINKRCPSFKKEIKAIFKIDEIREASSYLRNRIVETPVLKLSGTKISPYLPAAKSVAIKLELFQHVGSFKARGVLLAIKSLGSS